MRFIGCGGCSVVFALAPDEAAEIAPDAPAALRAAAALRIRRDAVPRCAVCLSALAGAAATAHALAHSDSDSHSHSLSDSHSHSHSHSHSDSHSLSDSHSHSLSHSDSHSLSHSHSLLHWRARCAAAHPAAAAYGAAPRAAVELTTDFSAAPAQFAQFAQFAGNVRREMCGGKCAAWVAVELKPKAAWRPPRVVGIAVDGVDYFLHSVKRRQCRFSLMQLRKRERGVPASASYCPNDLLFAESADSMAAVLSRLAGDAANNFRVLIAEGFPNGPEQHHFRIFAAALRFVGVLPVLTGLQLHGTNIAVAEEVLDIELLYRWSTARDASSVRWIVCDAASEETARCACHSSATPDIHAAAQSSGNSSTQYIKPPLDFERCVDAFYVSATAKDASIIISASVSADSSSEINPQFPKNVYSPSCGGFMVEFDTGDSVTALCRVGVVDLDSKRKKSLQHYYALDQEILGAWERQHGSPDAI